MNKKENLKMLVNFFGDLLKIEENEWLIDDILKVLGESTSIDEIAKHSLIQNIHEYCVEAIIKDQAEEFYSTFPLLNIKEQLINDFCKMEHERRRDDFNNYCLCMYQQIENIVNHLHSKNILNIWESEKDKIGFSFPDGNTKSIREIVFQNSNDWYANVKFRSVLFFIGYQRKLKVLISFNERANLFDELYLIRNQNHRGGTPTPKQRDIIKKIVANRSRYYFVFNGFLVDFIKQIEVSISEMDLNRSEQLDSLDNSMSIETY